MSCFGQPFGRVTEGAMSDVVQKSRKSDGVAIFSGYGWYILVAIPAELPSMTGISLKGPDHAFCGFHDPP